MPRLSWLPSILVLMTGLGGGRGMKKPWCAGRHAVGSSVDPLCHYDAMSFLFLEPSSFSKHQ